MEIKVKHPLEECNIKQADFLYKTPDKDKEYHSLLFSYGNATYLYHNLDIEATEEDYNEWLDGLDENIRMDMKAKGIEGCKDILSFTRYVREKKDIGMDEFVRKKMGEEEYEKYRLLFDNKE